MHCCMHCPSAGTNSKQRKKNATNSEISACDDKPMTEADAAADTDGVADDT